MIPKIQNAYFPNQLMTKLNNSLNILDNAI
jgi:hypothetical protein